MIGTIPYILLALSFLLLVVGGLWMIVEAFRRSIVWGLCYLFVPFAALFFVFVAWANVRRPFIISTVGFALLFVPLFSPPPYGLDLYSKVGTFYATQAGQLPNLGEALRDPRAALQIRLAELTAREATLRARKAALDPNDAAAARALTEEILRYNTDLKTATDEQSSLDAVATAH